MICTLCRRDGKITHCCHWQLVRHQSLDAVQWQRSTCFFSDPSNGLVPIRGHHLTDLDKALQPPDPLFDDRQRADVAGFVFSIFVPFVCVFHFCIDFSVQLLLYLPPIVCVVSCSPWNGFAILYQRTPSFSSATASCLFGGSNFRLNIFNCRPSLCSRAQCLQSYKKIITFIQKSQLATPTASRRLIFKLVHTQSFVGSHSG